MELRQLKYFIAIVDSGSMMKASAQLHIAQPSLSVQMAKLEQEFGVALLARKARGVTPTDAGAAFYRHAETIIKMLADSHEVVRRTKQTTAGRVRLGMPA